MFTGIIEEIGQIKGFTKVQEGADAEIECSKVLEGTRVGDSIAVNGCCQTVTSLSANCFSVHISEETLNVTNFKSLKINEKVNLERALTPSTRMGGHIVQGHIDCTAKYLGDMNFEISQNEAKYLIYKGSIAINGVSLTIAKVDKNVVYIAIIPHTVENTTLKYLKTGDTVNIETDVLGKYVEKFLSTQNDKSNITTNFLQENGFL